jgi:uncharacterized protein YutE (UPF0331/DUF86 family)
VLDREAILARLDKLDEYAKILRELQKAAQSDFVADYHLYGLAERYLQLSIECIIDIGSLCITGLGLRKPEDGQEVIDILREHKVITDDLAARFEGIVGFRNILVHEYTRIDRYIVYQSLHSHVSDLEQFAGQILALLKSAES